MLLALLLLQTALAKKPASPPSPPPLPAPAPMETGANPLVAEIMALKPAPADWYFVLDTSGGNLELAKAARPALASLVKVIPDGDRIAVVAMHTRPSDALPLSQIDAVNRQTLVDKITTLDLTSAKDADLGGGLSWAVHHLSSDTAAKLSFLVMVGPFCHSPSIASDYNSGGRGCRPILGLDKIAQSWADSKGDRVLQATLIEVAPPDGVIDPVGVEAVKRVFPGASTVEALPFSVWAEDFRQRLPLQRVLPLARADAERAALSLTVTRPPTEEHPIATITAHAGTGTLGVHLSNVLVNGVPYADVDLRPYATWEVPLPMPAATTHLLPTVEQVDLPVVVTADAELLPAEGLRAIGIDPSRPQLTARVSATVERHLGPTYLEIATLAVLGVIFAVLGVLYVQARSRKVLLEGAFSYRRVGQIRRRLDLSALSEAAICIGPDGELVLGRKSDAVVIVRMVKTSMGADAEIEVVKEHVEINSKAAAPGVHKVRAGATSVQFDDYRLTWE